MSRNKENNLLNSQQRSNGSIPSMSRTPQSDDFFTDSVLDVSKIPTPSPKKQAFSAAYKGRRVLGNTRTLKDAWNATSGTGRGYASGNEIAQPRQQPLKPSPVQIARRSPAAAQRNQRNATPSPPRVRHAPKITSPTSEVSQDLTDVYQRIADEEDLAAQEGELQDEDEEYTEDILHDSHQVTGREDLQENGRIDEAHVSHRDSYRPLPDQYAVGGNKGNLADEMTSMSEASGLSFLKEITDPKLAAALTPHTIDRARDRARLERAINNDKPILFHGHRPKHGLTTDNLVGNGSPAERLTRDDSSTGSVTTERSEPAPNVPRVWGTKAKAGKEWLRSRREASANGIKGSPNPESSQVDWAAAAAEVALPSVEDSSTPNGHSSRGSTPASLHKQKSLDRIRQWELNDFTGQSLQVSNSPPVRIKPILHNRDKSVEDVAKQAVTNDRLGEIGRKNSNDLVRRLSRSPSFSWKDNGNESILPPEKNKGVKFADEGEQIPDTPIVIYRSSSSVSKPDTEYIDPRPDHSRKESHDHLQRLAKAMSNSPKPSPSPEDWSLIGSEECLKKSNVQLDDQKQPVRSSDASRKSSKQVVDVDATPQPGRNTETAKTPVVTGAWTDTILPDTVKTVKKQDEHSRYAQTPHVNPGGWIDTPLPGKRQSSVLAPIPVEEETEELTDGIGQEQAKVQTEFEAAQPSSRSVVPKQPEGPTSVLATLLERAKKRLVSQDITAAKDSNETLNLGDATIESLEDLLTLDAADMTTLIRLGAEAEARDELLLGQHKNDPLAEAELLERLGSKLERLRTNIHDARKGISKLEHQVTHPDSGQQLQTLVADGPCEACGCPRTLPSLPTDYRTYLVLPIPRLFHRRRKDLGHWFLRPTLLGWMTLLAWCWYISESTMCELYCHPLYADQYDWPSEPEPVFPWALPTMLWRWSGIRGIGPIILGPLWTLLVAMFRVVGQAFGWTDGFVEDPYRRIGGASPVGLPMVGISKSGGVDMTMTNDEYI